jgi:general secretion pathway protein N
MASLALPPRQFILPFWLLLLVALVLAAGLLMMRAPASWLDYAVSQATSGRLRLADSAGTVWSGQAKLVFAQGGGETSALTGGVALPQAIHWNLEVLPLLTGRLLSEVRIEGMAQPVLLRGDWRSITGSAGAFELPSVTFDQIGSPWNTVQPQGKLSVRWQPFSIARGKFTGQAEVELASVSSALSTVKPLGHYKIVIQGQGEKAQIAMNTVTGPLMLSGDGQWSANGGLRFLASAEASGEEKTRLQPLLGLIGRREGERTIIKIGA